MTTHNDIEAGNKLTIRVLPTREWPDDRITIQIRSADQIVTVRNDGARNKAGPSPDVTMHSIRSSKHFSTACWQSWPRSAWGGCGRLRNTMHSMR